uniref:hypothetical protein n=1 Tax=Acetatifactor sp. TaxID=1872090 RepID=UPI00405666B7
MLNDIVDFFKLYIDEDAILYDSFGIVMLILFGSTIFYLIDFYNLVKRKTQAETIAIMSIPVLVSVVGATMATFCVHVPELGHLDAFAAVLTNNRLRYGLVLIVVSYAMLWFITYISQKKRKRKDVHKWLLSCIPDICFSVMILLGAVCQWIVRKDIFLWLYLYS